MVGVKKVLVIDDSETIRSVAAAALSRAGFEVLEAADGIQGLACAATNDISVIILDVNMPGLNGLEMLEKLVAEPRTAHLPVVMLTAEAHEAMIERAKHLGARGWMIKPIKPEHLVSVVTRLINTSVR